MKSECEKTQQCLLNVFRQDITQDDSMIDIIHHVKLQALYKLCKALKMPPCLETFHTDLCLYGNDL